MPLLVLNSVYLIYSALLLLFEVEISSKAADSVFQMLPYQPNFHFSYLPSPICQVYEKIRALIQSKCHPPHLPQQALLLIMGKQSCVKPHIGPHQQDCLWTVESAT